MTGEVQNCWVYMQCGREPGGGKVEELGVCPAAIEGEFDGINRGTKSGRVCWFVAGTRCNGEVQGTFARKLANCLKCPFYLEVERQEGSKFVLMVDDSLK